MAEVLKKFDRYFLLDRIAQGGMAEIYRARMVNADAGGRLIVIKRIQSGYGSNSEFVTMFKSEIKVTMGFNHPNIVQVHDFGDSEGQPYIAMEFVDGRNLRQFLTRFTELKQTVPIDLAAYVIEESAAGLFYAHSFKDKISGEPLNIIHRDISPQNIIISYEGNVKVIDFGIAKATTNSESTRAGVIKGKPSYLSPEQITGEVLDARCDIFALGTVLWELLTGRKLFSGENDLAVLKMIESCSTHVKPPSTLNPDVPKELDHIVLKALAKQRESRFQTCDEFRRALHKFIYAFNPDFNPGDLAYYAKDLFKNEIVDDRKRIQKLYEKSEKLINSELAIEQAVNNSTGLTPGAKEDTTTVFNLSGESQGNQGNATVLGTGRQSGFMQGQNAREARPPVGTNNPGGGRTAVEVGTKPNQQRNRPSGNTRSNVAPLQARESFDPAASSTKAIVMLGIVTVLAYLAGGRPDVRTLLCTITSLMCARPEPVQVATSPSPAAPVQRSIALRLRIPGGTNDVTATVGGKKIDPNQSVVVGLDQEVVVNVDKVGFKSFNSHFVIDSSRIAPGQAEFLKEVALEPTVWGILNIRSVPSAEAILIPRDASRSPSSDQTMWTKKTPLEGEKVPVGTYSLRLVNSTLGMEKTVTIQIQEGKIFTVDERLVPVHQ